MASNSNKKSLKFILFLLCCGIFVGMILSLGTAQIVEETSDDKFCTKCHTMNPMANSNAQDVHGGKNKTGFKANCTDCHLPHDNVFNYLYQKAKISIHDIRVQAFGDLESIDWEAKRKHAKNFVFDSACLSCHVDLKEATMSSQKAFVAHRDYFSKTIDKKCVQCHENVGHYNLGSHIKKAKKLQKKEQ